MAEPIPETPTEALEEANRLCRNCNQRPYLPQYPNALCLDCRQQFIHYPIPRWIGWFAAGILIIMVIGIVRMPKYLSAAIHLSRAEKAMEANLYLTAQKELRLVLETVPDHIPANGMMIVAATRNWDVVAVMAAYDKLVDKPIEDASLVTQVNDAMASIEQNYPKDTILSQQIKAIQDSPEKLEKLFASIDSANGEDVLFASTLVADKLYELKEWEASERILGSILKKQPDHYSALNLLVAVKRNQGNFDEALRLCDQMLETNRENVGIIAQKARIELKRKHDAQAAAYAREAMRMDEHDPHAMEAQSMVDFFANRKQASQALLSAIRKQEALSGDSTISVRLSAIFNGTSVYR